MTVGELLRYDTFSYDLSPTQMTQFFFKQFYSWPGTFQSWVFILRNDFTNITQPRFTWFILNMTIMKRLNKFPEWSDSQRADRNDNRDALKRITFCSLYKYGYTHLHLSSYPIQFSFCILCCKSTWMWICSRGLPFLALPVEMAENLMSRIPHQGRAPFLIVQVESGHHQYGRVINGTQLKHVLALAFQRPNCKPSLTYLCVVKFLLQFNLSVWVREGKW